MTDKDKRTKTEPSKGEINKILHNFKTEIEEVEKYIQSSFNDVEIMTTLQKEEKEKIKDIYSVQLNSLNFPFELNLDISFQHFYDSGVLKSFESKILQELFPKVFFSKRSKKMCRLLFLIVFILKFPKCILDEGSGLLATIRKNISKCYVKVFAELPKLKEELINLLIFSISYITHMSFYILFPRNQIQFKIRFILDVYHIAIFELNGICVSDYYLQNIFEKIFTSKFLDYEQQQNNSLDIKQEKLSAKNNERNFLGKKLIYPTIFKYEGGVDFADELMNRLKINKRSPRRYGLTTNNNKYSNDGKSNDLEEGTDNKRFKDETKKTSDTLSNHIFQSDKIKEREDSKKIFIANMNTKKKFNCIQISPAMSQVLEINNMNLPFNKKKLINHSMDKLYTQNLDYKEMFDDINNQRRNVKEAKKHNGRPKSISQKSITNNYGHMKVDYDEKAKKYPKLFCDMEDLYHILNKYDERFTTLASSKKTLSDYNKHNVLKFEEIKKEAEDEIKKRENQREGKKLLIENEKTKLLKNLEKEEEENKKKKGESAKQNEHENKNEEEVVELNNPRKSISTFFQLPQLVNKFSQNMTASKKNFQKSRQKNMSDSTAASLFKAEEEEEQVMDYSTLRKKINLNAVIEEGGQINHISDEEEKDSNQHNEKDLFLDKRREYFVKYSKMIKGNHDENIDELISKIMLKQNMLSRKLIAGFNNKKKLGNHKLSKVKINF